MASPFRKFLLKRSSGDVIVRHEMRRAKSDSTTKMQIMIRSFESIDKNLHWELPPDTHKIGLPSTRSLFTVLKSPHVHKKAREQFQMKINKEMLVMEAKRHELRKKFFWLKRQRIFGAQFEILFSYKTRLDKGKLQGILQPGLKDVSKKGKLEERSVMTTLHSLAKDGFYSDAMDFSLNSIEPSFLINNIGLFSHGLPLMLRSVPMAALKARVDNEGSKPVSTQLIEKIILNNPHRPTVDIQPGPEHEAYLEKLKGNMTEEGRAELTRVTCDLMLNPPAALKAIRSSSLQSISTKPMQVPIEVGDINGAKVLQHDLLTNDVLHADIAFDMSSLKAELLPLVPLFCRSLLEMGTKDLNFIQLNQLIGRKTGGISVYPFTSSKQGSKDPVSHIIVRGKSVSASAEDLFNLIACVLQDSQFTNQKRFKRFVSESKARLENQLRDGGHLLAATRMNAKLNRSGWIAEQMGGIRFDFTSVVRCFFLYE